MMANGNAAAGMTPRRLRNGSPWNCPLRTYHVPASNTTPLYVGDPVLITGTGDSMGYPDVAITTAGGRITGSVQGFRPNSPFPGKFLPAGVEGYVLVGDDPNALYEVQEDAIGGALTEAAIGLNANLIPGPGNGFTGQSGWLLDSSTAATTATLQVRIVELQHRADNEKGINAKWLVAINLPTETGAAGSTGV